MRFHRTLANWRSSDIGTVSRSAAHADPARGAHGAGSPLRSVPHSASRNGAFKRR